MEINITGWAVFWIALVAAFSIDTAIFLKGYDTFWWTHRTDAEKEIQRIKIEKLKESK